MLAPNGLAQCHSQQGQGLETRPRLGPVCPDIDGPVVDASENGRVLFCFAHGILIFPIPELRKGRVRNLNREASSEASMHHRL